MRKITPEEDDFLKENYLKIPAKKLSKMMGRSESSARQRLALLGLVVPEEITAKFKAESYFKKGDSPANKGKKQVDYMSADAIERTRLSRFKKGNIPSNAYNEVGKITTRYDLKNKGGKPYKYICLALGVWKPLHQHLWGQINGDVPKGYCLWFKDGNTLNCTIENLECITRKENRFRNASHQKLGDLYLAKCLVGRNGDYEAVLDEPELLQSKKLQILINRKIKQNGTK